MLKTGQGLQINNPGHTLVTYLVMRLRLHQNWIFTQCWATHVQWVQTNHLYPDTELSLKTQVAEHVRMRGFCLLHMLACLP